MNKPEQWHLTPPAAELYEQVVARYILGPWAPLLVEAAHVSAGERLLDVACGTGVVARAAAERIGTAGSIVGIDLNPGMVAVAARLPQPAGARIEWLERSALDLQLPGASFDVVLCQQGLQFFPDKLLAMREMRRVLVPEGRLAISVWNSAGRYNSAVGKVLAAFLGNKVAARFCASRAAPSKEEIEQFAADAGLLDVEVRIQRLEVHFPRLENFVLDHLAATPVSSVIADADEGARKGIGAAVMNELRSYADRDGVTFPEETYVLTATTGNPDSRKGET